MNADGAWIAGGWKVICRCRRQGISTQGSDFLPASAESVPLKGLPALPAQHMRCCQAARRSMEPGPAELLAPSGIAAYEGTSVAFPHVSA